WSLPDAGILLRDPPPCRATTSHTRSFMNGEESADRDALLETFAAELTVAAYDVALRARIGGSWVDLELGLWKVLADKVKRWGRDIHVRNGTPHAWLRSESR